MKNLLSITAFCLLNAAHAQTEQHLRFSPEVHVPKEQPAIRFPKSMAAELGTMKFVRGGTFTFAGGTMHFAQETDSTLCFANNPYRGFVESCYLSDHEVTNREYDAFIAWVKDSVKTADPAKLRYAFPPEKGMPGVAVLPDTIAGADELGRAGSRSSAFYGDHPVSGITWYQALAYCHWKTQQINRKLEKEGLSWRVRFSLPTAEEWEYAALSDPASDAVVTDRREYPWLGRLTDEKGQYRANFGTIVDRNGVPLKERSDDGHYGTAPVRSFSPNQNGLYDMAGNVAEWTLDSPALASDSVQVQYTLKYGQRLFPGSLNSERLARFAPARVVKGGSFANGPAYLQGKAVQLFSEDKAHATIGFRVKMVVVEGK